MFGWFKKKDPLLAMTTKRLDELSFALFRTVLFMRMEIENPTGVITEGKIEEIFDHITYMTSKDGKVHVYVNNNKGKFVKVGQTIEIGNQLSIVNSIPDMIDSLTFQMSDPFMIDTLSTAAKTVVTDDEESLKSLRGICFSAATLLFTAEAPRLRTALA
jgi:hypothetical protein